MEGAGKGMGFGALEPNEADFLGCLLTHRF